MTRVKRCPARGYPGHVECKICTPEELAKNVQPQVTTAEALAFLITQKKGQLLRTAQELLDEAQQYVLLLENDQITAVCGVNPSTVTHLFTHHATILALQDALRIVQEDK